MIKGNIIPNKKIKKIRFNYVLKIKIMIKGKYYSE